MTSREHHRPELYSQIILIVGSYGMHSSRVRMVKIDGVHHELSTIPELRKIKPLIILNLKGLTASFYGEGPKTIYIERSRRRVVTRRRHQDRHGHSCSRYAHCNTDGTISAKEAVSMAANSSTSMNLFVDLSRRD